MTLKLISHEVHVPIDEGDNGEVIGYKMTAQLQASQEVQIMMDEET